MLSTHPKRRNWEVLFKLIQIRKGTNIRQTSCNRRIFHSSCVNSMIGSSVDEPGTKNVTDEDNSSEHLNLLMNISQMKRSVG